jgi:hypothetical protein
VILVVVKSVPSVWDVAARRHIADLEGAEEVVCAVPSPDGRFVATVNMGDQLELWDAETGAKMRDLTTDDEPVIGSVAFSPDGRRLAVGGGGVVHLWNTGTWGEDTWRPERVLKPEHDDILWRVAFSSDGRRLLGQGTCIWDVETGQVLRSLPDVGEQIALSPDGATVALGDENVTLWDVTSGERLAEIEQGGVQDLEFSPDGAMLATGSDDGVVRLWDPRTRSLLHSLEGHQGGVTCVAFAPDGSLLVSGGDDGTLRLWRTESGRVRVIDVLDTGSLVRRVAFAAGSRARPGAEDEDHADIEAAVLRIRRAFADGPLLGLHRWFEVFDECALRSRIEACAALLQDLREEGYPLDDDELRYVRSREGALELIRGVRDHRAGELDRAEERYRRSLAIQKEVACGPAQGQILVLLEILADSRRDPGSDMEAELRNELGAIHVLGGGETLLTRRLGRAPAVERRAIVVDAVEARAAGPLLEALRSEDAALRGLAAAGLSRLDCAIPIDDLAGVLRDERWFVRWRAAALIGTARGEGDRAQAQALLVGALDAEPDPEVRRTIVGALGKVGDRSATPSIARALADQDVEVRWAALGAAEAVGDRRALGPLNAVRPGRDMIGRDLVEQARKAAAAIGGRFRLPSVRGLATERRRGEGFEPARLFWVGEELALSFTLTDDGSVRVRLRDGAGALVWSLEAPYADLLRREPAPSSAEASAGHLVELLEDDAEPSKLDVGARVRLVRYALDARAKLLIGDTGTVRIIEDDWVGVEWDRNVGGHELHDSATCRPGHGWFVRPSRLVVEGRAPPTPVARVLMRLPTDHEKTPGTYRVGVEVLDADTGTYEGQADLELEVVAAVDVRDAFVTLPRRPDLPTEVVLSGEEATCSVLVERAPKGTLVFLSSGPPTPAGATEVMVTAETTREAEEQVDLSWSVRWPVGLCRLTVGVDGRRRRQIPLTVVAAVAIRSATLCAGVDESLRPQQRAQRFGATQEVIHCVAELTEAPASMRVVAVWEYIDDSPRPIVDCVAVIERWGAQPIAFALTRPSNGWPRGRYRLRLAVLSPGESEPIAPLAEPPGSAWSFIESRRWTTAVFSIE